MTQDKPIYLWNAKPIRISLFAITMQLSSSCSPSCSTPSGWEVKMVPLSFGFLVLACAVSPYALAIPFPAFFENSFFLPTYSASKAGRRAEIGWKVRYATLGFALTALTFLEVISGRSDPEQILRDSYILWAIFYTDAALKVNKIQYLFGVICRPGYLILSYLVFFFIIFDICP